MKYIVDEENPFRNIIPVQKFDANKASKDELIQFIEKQNKQLKDMSYQICVLLHMNERNDDARQEREWISVKERLPEEAKRYLVSTSYGDVMTDYFDSTVFICNLGNVVAWQPLPKPYEGGNYD